MRKEQTSKQKTKLVFVGTLFLDAAIISFLSGHKINSQS